MVTWRRVSKAQKFILFSLALIILVLFFAYQSGSVTMNWNDLFNGTIQTVLGSFIGMALTILVYRYLYHRGSRR